MRSLLVLLLLCSAASAKTKVLVLPLPESDVPTAAFDARLVVALDETGRVSAVTPPEEPECVTVDCLADLGVNHDAEQVLSVSLLREGATITLFATLVDVKNKTAARRTEITGLDTEALGKRAPAELARWVGGAKATKTLIGVSLPASGVAREAALELADRLKANGFATAALERREDRTNLSHRAEVTISSFSIVKKRHHVHRYFDGAMVATITVTDLATREVAFTKTVNVTASKRARYSSVTEITGMLVTEALDQWMAAFNLTGRNK